MKAIGFLLPLREKARMRGDLSCTLTSLLSRRGRGSKGLRCQCQRELAIQPWADHDQASGSAEVHDCEGDWICDSSFSKAAQGFVTQLVPLPQFFTQLDMGFHTGKDSRQQFQPLLSTPRLFPALVVLCSNYLRFPKVISFRIKPRPSRFCYKVASLVSTVIVFAPGSGRK